MATYLKRAAAAGGAAAGGAKSSGAGLGPPSLICPVCRGVLREPVRLPCAHTLCLSCLQKTVQHATLSCPLCRLRLGSWLRANANANHSLVDPDLDRLVRDAFPQKADPHKHEHDLPPKRILSAAGEIRKEYEAQLQLAEEEMRRQRENERLASEALIRKIQEEEEQQKLVQLAQDQLLAKTLAKSEVLGKPSEKLVRNSRLNNLNLDKAKTDAIQSKPSPNQKMSVKSKGSTDTKKTNVALISKIRSERYASNAKSSGSSVQKGASETFSSQKPVPIHNAVTRVVTHQSRASHSKNSTISAALGELIGSTSKIYGLQCKEELQVPSDVISSKKKKLGVEVVTTVEGEERIGSAESAGSHDSINQEIHHFKPIRACSRTPLRVLDGKQIDPKLIRVLPILKRVSNAVPKPPTPTHLRKNFGCSWSAFKRISRQQLVLHKDSSSSNQQETKKTDNKKSDSSRGTGKSAKTVQDIYERNSDTLAFDTNKNYTKNVNKIINGTKVSKKLNLDNQVEGTSINVKQNKRRKVKNGLLPSKHKKEISKKAIEIVEIEDDEPAPSLTTTAATTATTTTVVAPTTKIQTPDPLAFTPKNDATRSQSPEMDYIIENIAERIKRRNNTKTTSNTENALSAINMAVPTQQVIKAKSKKPSLKVSKTQQKTKKTMVSTKPLKKKVPVVTSVTSHIKKLAARSMKRPRYTEDSESEPEPEPEPQPETEPELELEPEPEPEPEPKADEEKSGRRLSASEEQRELEANELAELDRSASDMITPSPPKKPRRATKASKSKKKQVQPKKSKATTSQNHVTNEEELDEASIIREQERLERLAAQEREDREIALQLQARFASMERVANRTRRGQATRVPSPQILNEIIQEKRPQKRTAPVN